MEQLATDRDQPIAIVGHSYGGGDALALQNRLEKEGFQVDYVATIDPYVSPFTYSRDDLHAGYDDAVNDNYVQILTPFYGEWLKGVDDTLIWKNHFDIDEVSSVQYDISGRINTLHNSYYETKDRFSSRGGSPVVLKSGKTILGRGGQSGSFKCYASSCSASKAYKKPVKKNG